MRSRWGVSLALAVFAAMLSAGCAAKPSSPAELKGRTLHWVKTELYFGLSKPGGGVVSDGEWKVFLAEVVTPRFPDGLTVYDASGQWRGQSGELTREQTRVVVIVHERSSARASAIREVIAEYKKRFGQESVLWVDQPAVAEF